MVLALGAIVIIGALIVSGFFASSLRRRTGDAALSQVRAMSAVDYGENETLIAGLPIDIDSLPIGATSPPAGRAVPGGGTSSATVTRLQQNLFLLVTVGSADSPWGRGVARRSGFLFRLADTTADGADSVATPRVPVRVAQRAWINLF